MPGVGIVDGHPDLERPAAGGAAGVPEDRREHDGVPRAPIVVLVGLAGQQSPLVEAVVERVETDLLVPLNLVEPVGGVGDILALTVAQVVRQIGVQPLGVYRVHGVLHALEPVAWHHGRAHVAEQIVADEQVPSREQRHGRRAHVGPDESAKLLDRVARNLHLLLETSVRMDGLLEGLLDALAGLVHHPAVIHAAQAVLLRYAVREIDAAMRAGALNETERPGLVLVEHQVLAEQAHRLGGLVLHLLVRCHDMPVAAHQLSAGCARPHTRESFVLLLRKHQRLLDQPDTATLGADALAVKHAPSTAQ